MRPSGHGDCAAMLEVSDEAQALADGPQLAGLKPLGQIRESFILAVDHDGLWIVDQHVAHERVLFERVLKQRNADHVEQQRMLMPMIVELTPGQQTIFAEISDELRRNGFEVEIGENLTKDSKLSCLVHVPSL